MGWHDISKLLVQDRSLNKILRYWLTDGRSEATIESCVQSQNTEQGQELTTGIASKCITMVQLLNRPPAVKQETQESFISYSRQKENAGCPDKISEKG
jgi:hypothetical protein